jgi:hypothetical protein
MSRKLTITFNILLVLYVILIICNWYAIIPWVIKEGLFQGLMNVDILYELFIIIMLFFLYKKNIKSLFISTFLLIFWVSTSSLYIIVDKSFIQTLAILVNNINAGFYQLFILRVSTFSILTLTIIGICFYFYDESKNNDSND